jgi:hypothetical protein
MIIRFLGLLNPLQGNTVNYTPQTQHVFVQSVIFLNRGKSITLPSGARDPLVLKLVFNYGGRHRKACGMNWVGKCRVCIVIGLHPVNYA